MTQEQQIKEIHDKVDKLYTAVCGDECMGLEGLVQRVDKTEKYIENDKRQKWMIAGAVTVITTGIAGLINKIIS